MYLLNIETRDEMESYLRNFQSVGQLFLSCSMYFFSSLSRILSNLSESLYVRELVTRNSSAVSTLSEVEGLCVQRKNIGPT